MQQLDNYLAHVIWNDEVLEEEGDLIHITTRRRVLQIIIGNVLRDELSGCSAQEKLEHDGSYRIDVAQLGYSINCLILFHQDKFLDVVALQVDLAILLEGYLCQLIKYFDLLRWDVVFVPGADVE